MTPVADPSAPAHAPLVVVVGGPNGAGKSTTAPQLLQGALAVEEFVNADTIASGLSGFRPESAAVAAGRVMLDRLHALADARVDFAFETTLASRSFAVWLQRLRASGYRAHLAFLSLRTADLAVRRVAERVRLGGHDVPEEVVRRRYASGVRNLLRLYPGAVDSWQVFDNSSLERPRLIASGERDGATSIIDARAWNSLLAQEGRCDRRTNAPQPNGSTTSL